MSMSATYTSTTGLTFQITVRITSGDRGGFMALIVAEDHQYRDMPVRVYSTPRAAIAGAQQHIERTFA